MSVSLLEKIVAPRHFPWLVVILMFWQGQSIAAQAGHINYVASAAVSSPTDGVLSANGKFFFVVSSLQNTLHLFHFDQNRHPQRVESYDITATVANNASAWSASLSSDDSLLYLVTRKTSNANSVERLLVFSVDDASGVLSLLDYIENGPGTTERFNLPAKVMTNPLTGVIYVLNSGSNDIDTFYFDSTSNKLAYKGRLGATLTDLGISAVSDLALSADGRSLFVASATDNAVVVLELDETTGEATAAHARLEEGVNGVTGLTGVSRILPSGDGNGFYAYAAGSSLSVFGRNGITGDFFPVQSYQQGGPGSYSVAGQAINGLTDSSAMAVSADGSKLLVSSVENKSIAVFNRSAASNKLSFLGTINDGENGNDGLAGVTKLVFRPDSSGLISLALDKLSGSSQDLSGQVAVFDMANVDLDLSVLESADPIKPGESLTYLIKVSNFGQINADEVVISGSLPAEVMIQAAAPCALEGGSDFFCSLGTLIPNAEKMLELTVIPGTEGDVLADMVVLASQTDPVVSRLQVITSVSASAENTAPMATDDMGWTTLPDQALEIPVLANDSDADGDALLLHELPDVTEQGGSVAQLPDGILLFTPAEGFVGRDAFTYTITDSLEAYASAKVEIVVNTPPQAVNDTITIAIRSDPIAVQVLANDLDADGHALSIKSYDMESNIGGKIKLWEEGGLIYSATAVNEPTEDIFSYTIIDELGAEATASVMIKFMTVEQIKALSDPADPDNSTKHKRGGAGLGPWFLILLLIFFMSARRRLVCKDGWDTA